MELLSNTSSPSITINSTLSSDSIYQIPMEANNLTQQAETEALAATGNEAGTPGVANDSAGDNVSIDEGHPVEQDFSTLLPRMELKLPILSSSSSESETEETPANPIAGTSTENCGERTASPPPNCAICLGRCKNKCFTDSCMHQFCFKCLCEWSKVKPECPLCKQTFKSIIHNVKSIDQFEEYHVQPPIVQIAHNQFDFPQMRMIVHQDLIRNDGWIDRGRHQRFVFTSNNAVGSSSDSILASVGSGVGSRGNLRNLNDYNGEFLDLYRQEHQITSNDTLSQLWRRFVYDRKLYALPVCDVNGRFRDSSAQFYRENPAQIHRLAPWINRDIVCLMRQTQTDVTTVVESIHAALTMMNILSPGFRRRMIPYLGNKTSHFIHELNNFARSPHDMFGYDSVVQYSPQSNEELVIEFSSSDDSTDNEIDVADDLVLATGAGPSTNAINLTIHNRLVSISARGGDTSAAGGGSTSMSRQDTQDDVNLVIDLRGDTEEQSAASVASLNASEDSPNQSVPQVAENIELTSGSSDECEFVLERKPPHLRTPEMVSLDSASDSDVVFVDESKPLSKATFSTSEGEPDETVATERPKRPTTRSKITALVEAKKRNQQLGNTMKNDSQVSSEFYNVGASTSAALRLSIQRGGGDSARTRRSAYCLRNKRAGPEQPQRRGKRLASESSHSTCSMGEADSSFCSSSSSSDEEFVAASTLQKQNSNPRKRQKTKKSKNGRCSNAAKRNASKRKKHNEDESSGDEDDNGHMGKNFALVMAIGERLKRQKAKRRNYRPAGASDEDDDSLGEHTWRMEAIDEPLRQRQQKDKVKTKTMLKTTERKRKVRRAVQKKNEQQASPVEATNETETVDARTENVCAYNNCASSSDESDNLKLIELKSKLNTKCSSENLEETSTSANCLTEEVHEKNSAESLSQNASSVCADSSLQSTSSPAPSPRPFFKMEEEDVQSSTDDNEQDENVGPQDMTYDAAEQDETTNHQEREEFIDPDGDIGGQVDIEFTQQLNGYSNQTASEYNEAVNMPSPMAQEDIEEDGEEHQLEHMDDECSTPLNMQMQTPLNLSHESQAFDGTSMSATTNTTDTILNDAAEQISSAAVNFYDPQPTFNTADFADADENTSNSSTSESSVSTTTTTSSGNSSSSNTNGFVNFDIS